MYMTRRAEKREVINLDKWARFPYPISHICPLKTVP
jgi:hypothetical protein